MKKYLGLIGVFLGVLSLSVYGTESVNHLQQPTAQALQQLGTRYFAFLRNEMFVSSQQDLEDRIHQRKSLFSKNCRFKYFEKEVETTEFIIAREEGIEELETIEEEMLNRDNSDYFEFVGNEMSKKVAFTLLSVTPCAADHSCKVEYEMKSRLEGVPLHCYARATLISHDGISIDRVEVYTVITVVN